MALFPFLGRDKARLQTSYSLMRSGRGPRGLKGRLRYLWATLWVAVSRLQTSTDPAVTLSRLKAHKWSYRDLIYVLHVTVWIFWLRIMVAPLLLKLGIPILYLVTITLPITSQFFFPALPIFTWLITFFSSRFIPVEYRPSISVSLLPTLESVLYGANISDILTRFTHPILDIPAWLSYGIIHFVGPFVVAAFLWLFGAKGSLLYWARAFGYLNFTGVVIQILFPCAPPWYELRNGLTPADYTMKGSPGGLARIDAIFHSNAYTVGFSQAPVVFGAFPSLHAGDATMAVLFVSHFWPWLRLYAWGYAGVLYWATMYLTHHYLIDVVCGACLSAAFFYLFMPASMRSPDNTTNTNYAIVNGTGLSGLARDRYAEYGLDGPSPRTNGHAGMYENDSLSDEDADAPPNPLTPYGHSRRTSSPFPGSGAPMASPRITSIISSNSVPGKSHRHTASIASLIRADERVEEGWSPVRKDFAFPPQVLSAGPNTPAPVSSVAPAIPSPIPGTQRLGVPEGSAGSAGFSASQSLGAVQDGAIVRSRSPSWPDHE